MTLAELKSILPPDHKASIMRGPRFLRCMIQDSMGRPVGIGEDKVEEVAIQKAWESYGRKG